jgi:uncharacterized membrane protein YidH (DUF202 family)
MPTDSQSTSEEPVKTYLDRSIFALVVFWPLGIVALIYSILASATRQHNQTRAREYASLAAAWGMAALGMFIVVLIGIFAAVVLFPSWF